MVWEEGRAVDATIGKGLLLFQKGVWSGWRRLHVAITTVGVSDGVVGGQTTIAE